VSVSLGWTEAFTRGVTSPDETERAAALGVAPRRCLRTPEARTYQSRRRGNRKSQLARSKALRQLIEQEEP